MIKETIKVIPRYGEVDKMGYVYHGNYASYFHQARTELLRKYGIDDNFLEKNKIILPVIDLKTKFCKPSFYDEELNVNVEVREFPITRIKFYFEIENSKNEIVCTAESTVCFCDLDTRKPMKIPSFVEEALVKSF